MQQVEPGRLRNVALVGHSGSGKTTLVEAALVAAGVLGRAGRVEDGSTVCDFEPEEAKRGISLSSALAPIELGGIRLTLIDTPGYADFEHEAATALHAAELAAVVVSGVDGIQVGTEQALQLASEIGVPAAVIVTKLERERANFDGVVEALRKRLGTSVVPVQLPVGTEESFRAVVDLLGQGDAPAGADAMSGAIAEAREALVEAVVVQDEALMERYLEGEVPTPGELAPLVGAAVAAGSLVPVMCCSAASGAGVRELLDALCRVCPSPLQRPASTIQAGDVTQDLASDPAGPTVLSVWKTITDPYVGRLSVCKVLSGALRPDAVVVNSRTRTEEHLHGLQVVRGKEHLTLDAAACGEIVALAKLADAATGDTLAPKGTPVNVTMPLLPAPVYSIAIAPKESSDDDKLMTALARLAEEDPVLRVERVDETHQTVLSGTGDAHLAVTCERLQRRYGVAVVSAEVIVPYRETVTVPAEAEGKYKKQTGGHGQYGVANLKIAPLPRGEGFTFVDKIVGGAIPRQYIPAVEKGVAEAMSRGVVWGFPVVDVSVTCFDGKFHSVDSSELSFKMAGALGFREAMVKAQPVLLEPVSRVDVTVPSEFQGDVMGDLTGRRGRVVGTESLGGGQVQLITALVPAAELGRYSIDLRSLTQGRGRVRMVHDHYDMLPTHIAEKVPHLREE